MSSLAKKHDDAAVRPLGSDMNKADKDPKGRRALGLTSRALLILFLLNRSTSADFLSFANPGVSIATTMYLGALVVMAGSLVLFWRNFTNEPAPTEANPSTPAARRVYGLFSEPWYEVPAVSCMLLASVGFIFNLVAEPPDSTRAKWFVASFVLAAIAAPIQWFASRARTRGKDRPGTRDGEQAGWPRTGPLSDPAFRVPLLAFAPLVCLHEGVPRIDAEPSSVVAWFLLVLGLALAITAVVSLIHNLRRKALLT